MTKIKLQTTLLLVILSLLGVISILTCNSPSLPVPKSDTTIIKDTTWAVKDSIIYEQELIPIYVKVPVSIPDSLKADTSYTVLDSQYTAVVKEWLTTRTYRDSFSFDSSKVTIFDTVSQNRLVGRSVAFQMRYPVYTESTTVTTVLPYARKLYAGGAFSLNKGLNKGILEAGLLYKDRKEHIYQFKVSFTTHQELYYGLGFYTPIN